MGAQTEVAEDLRQLQRDLAELLRRERPDVLHLHNPYPLLSPSVVRTAHAHGVPVVQHGRIHGERLLRPARHVAGLPLSAVRHAS